MKKKILISLLIVSFFNYIGCYSYSTITEEDIQEGRPKIDEPIKIVLEDEREIKCYPYTHVKLDEQSDFIVGKGDALDMQKGIQYGFEGRIDRNIIDSSRIIETNSGKQSIHWLKNGSRITFSEGNFLNVTPELSTGYYLGNGFGKGTTINFNEVKEIQIEKVDVAVTTIGIVLGIAACVGLGFLLASWEPDLSGLDNFFNTNYTGGY